MKKGFNEELTVLFITLSIITFVIIGLMILIDVQERKYDSYTNNISSILLRRDIAINDFNSKQQKRGSFTMVETIDYPKEFKEEMVELRKELINSTVSNKDKKIHMDFINFSTKEINLIDEFIEKEKTFVRELISLGKEYEEVKQIKNDYEKLQALKNLKHKTLRLKKTTEATNNLVIKQNELQREIINNPNLNKLNIKTFKINTDKILKE